MGRVVASFFNAAAWIRDARFALRQLTRHPQFTMVALLTLGLGVGVNTAVFSVAHAVVLKEPPYYEPGRLVELQGVRLVPTPIETKYLSIAQRDDVLAQNQSLGAFASYTPIVGTLTGVGEPASVTGLQVSGRFFETYGVRPIHGRTIDEADTESKQPQVVVLSHSLWQNRFGADPSVIGKPAYLSAQPANVFTPFVPPGRPFEVVGVMPPSSEFPIEGDIWLPLPVGAYTSAMGMSPREVRRIATVTRMRPGASVRRANAELQDISLRLAETYPDTDAGWHLRVVPLRTAMAGDFGASLLLLLGAVGIVFLLACVGLSSLLVARNSARYREIAIRETLGADRVQLIRLFFAESIVLALAAGALGLAFAVWSQALITSFAPPGIPAIDAATLNWSVFGYALGVSLLASVLIAVAPAIQLTTPELSSSVRVHHDRSLYSPGFRMLRLRGVLISFQLALAIPLVAASILTVRSFDRLSRVDLGFRQDGVLTASVRFGSTTCRAFSGCLAAIDEVLTRIRAIPGVENAAFSGAKPLSIPMSLPVTDVEDWDGSHDNDVIAQFEPVTPEYFSVLGISLRRGRLFGLNDAFKTPLVAVVNQALASRLFADGEALGRYVNLAPAGRPALLEIVGIVGDVRDVAHARDPQPTFYTPLHQSNFVPRTVLLVKSALEPTALAGQVRDQVLAVDKNAPVTEIAALKDVAKAALADARFAALVFSLFAVLSVALALVGTYGLISYAVTGRLREFAVRQALGAQRSDVLKQVLSDGVFTVGWGVTFGVAAALGLGRILRSRLFEIGPADPLTHVTVVIVVVAVATLGYYVPARRAMSADPMSALKRE